MRRLWVRASPGAAFSLNLKVCQVLHCLLQNRTDQHCTLPRLYSIKKARLKKLINLSLYQGNFILNWQVTYAMHQVFGRNGVNAAHIVTVRSNHLGVTDTESAIPGRPAVFFLSNQNIYLSAAYSLLMLHQNCLLCMMLLTYFAKAVIPQSLLPLPLARCRLYILEYDVTSLVK